MVKEDLVINYYYLQDYLRESRNRLKNVDFIVNNGILLKIMNYLMSFLPSKFVHLNSGKSYSIDDGNAQ